MALGSSGRVYLSFQDDLSEIEKIDKFFIEKFDQRLTSTKEACERLKGNIFNYLFDQQYLSDEDDITKYNTVSDLLDHAYTLIKTEKEWIKFLIFMRSQGRFKVELDGRSNVVIEKAVIASKYYVAKIYNHLGKEKTEIYFRQVETEENSRKGDPKLFPNLNF